MSAFFKIKNLNMPATGHSVVTQRECGSEYNIQQIIVQVSGTILGINPIFFIINKLVLIFEI